MESSHIIQSGNKAVVISRQGANFSARLYVNARDGVAQATPTHFAKSFKTENGVKRWASKVLGV